MHFHPLNWIRRTAGALLISCCLVSAAAAQPVVIDIDSGAVFDGILDGFPTLAALDGVPDFPNNALATALRTGATEERGIGEFPLAALGDAEPGDIASAILTFNIDDVLSTFGPGTDFSGAATQTFLVHVFDGNGMVELSDFLSIGRAPHIVDTTVHGRITDASLRQSGPLVFTIDVTDDLRAVVAAGALSAGFVWRTTESPTGTSIDDLGDSSQGPPGVNGARLPFLTIELQAAATPTATATFTPIEPTATAVPTETPTPEATATAPATDTPVPTATRTPAATATSTLARSTATSTPLTPIPTHTPAFDGCPGDCNDSGHVGTDELMMGIRMALGIPLAAECLAFDWNGDGSVTVDEVVRAVGAAIDGC